LIDSGVLLKLEKSAERLSFNYYTVCIGLYLCNPRLSCVVTNLFHDRRPSARQQQLALMLTLAVIERVTHARHNGEV